MVSGKLLSKEQSAEAVQLCDEIIAEETGVKAAAHR